jgi:hypothetical protein
MLSTLHGVNFSAWYRCSRVTHIWNEKMQSEKHGWISPCLHAKSDEAEMSRTRNLVTCNVGTSPEANRIFRYKSRSSTRTNRQTPDSDSDQGLTVQTDVFHPYVAIALANSPIHFETAWSSKFKWHENHARKCRRKCSTLQILSIFGFHALVCNSAVSTSADTLL